MGGELTHFNEEGRARMVDVTEKGVTIRMAVATGKVYMQPSTLEKIKGGAIEKGDVLAVAQVAGIMGAKKTPDFIPMCHPILITGVDIGFEADDIPDKNNLCAITIKATVRSSGQTGVEMEALSAVTIAALTIYDMCKAVDKGISFDEIYLLSKSGGRSGTYERKD